MSHSRIMIIGGPGSGKTWLARQLGDRYALPVYSVDDAVWDEHGTLRHPDEIDSRVRALAIQDRWIIEGGNTRTYADRVARADLILRLVPALWLRVWRVMCRNGFRPKLLWWTVRYDTVFGLKDAAALRSGRATAECCEIESRRDLLQLLQRGAEQFG
jgi:hypothetical protein